MRVTVIFAEGGLASCAITPMDIFRSAGVIWNDLVGQAERPPFQVTTASANGEAATCHGGARILPDRSIGKVTKTELIFVPSIGLELDEGLERNAKLIAWLKRWHGRGVDIAAVCSGVSLLAEAGILDGKPATTHWGLVEEYRQRYPAVDWQPELFITDADGICCGAGVYASLDLSLHLVERYAGRTVATQCAKALLIETPRAYQSGYAPELKRRIHDDERIHAVQDWLKENYRQAFHFDELASQMHMSPRNFVRRFKQATGETPLAYLQRLRIGAAKELLEQDYKTIQAVAAEVGYDDVAFFRNLFRRHTGISPNAYRRRFGYREQPAPMPGAGVI